MKAAALFSLITPNVSTPASSPTSPAAPAEVYQLRLFVTGTTPRSLQSVARLKAICERHFGGRYDLEVVDVYQQPALAVEAQVVAAPTLVRMYPLPQRKLTGSLDDEGEILELLGRPAAPSRP